MLVQTLAFRKTTSTSPKRAQLVRSYSYREISPHTTGHCDLHNQTTDLSET